MAAKTIEITRADGQTMRYVITHVLTDVGLEGVARLANITGPAASQLPDTGLHGFRIASLMSGLLGNRDLAEHLKWFSGEFAKTTQVYFPDGKSRTLADVYSVHFQGETMALMTWIQACLEHNYGSFLAPAQVALSKLVELASMAIARAILKSQNPAAPEGSGPSGASASADISTPAPSP